VHEDAFRIEFPSGRTCSPLRWWEGSAVTSDWFAEHVDHRPALAWDVYYLFGPDASWTQVPGL
jgi:hypothetical protein